MTKHLLKTFVAFVAIAAMAIGPVRGQSNHTKYTSSVAMSALQVGDTLAEGFSLTGGDANTIYFVANRHKNNENLFGSEESINLGWIESIGANCVFSTHPYNEDYTTTFAPVDENGRDGDAWVVTEVENIAGFTYLTIAGIRIPGPPITVRMAAGTEEAANWSLSSGNASVDGTQVLENVMSGSELTATYSGTRKVKSVKAVKYVPPVPVQSIVLDKQTASLAKDSTMTLSATVLPENAADKSYSWSSDDIAVADVDQNGVVTGHTAGTANIIATANDGSGAKDTCVVTVIVLQPVTLDGVTVLYASDDDTWSTVMGYNPGVMYLDGDNVRLTSNDAFLFYDDFQTSASEIFNPLANDHYQWMRVIEIGGSEFYYHQGETWQDAIDANRQGNNDWSIHGGQVKFMDDLTLIDTDGEPVDPSATIDPTVDYGYIME